MPNANFPVNTKTAPDHWNIGAGYLAVSEAGTDEWLRRVEAFEAAAGFAHVSHKPPSDGAQAGSADQAEPIGCKGLSLVGMAGFEPTTP